MKNMILIILLIIFIPVAIYGVKIAFFPVKVVASQIDSGYDIIDKTYKAENAIYNYEWFKDMYEKIKATEIQIDNTQIEMTVYKEDYGTTDTWDWQTKQDYSQLRTTHLGQKNYYELLVADYNAKSKQAHRNIFKDGLPFNVNKRLW